MNSALRWMSAAWVATGISAALSGHALAAVMVEIADGKWKLAGD